MIEHEFRDRARDICVAHQRQRAIVKDQPLIINARCDGGMIFVREQVFQDNDLDILPGNTCLQQRSIFEDRVVFTVTATGQERFKRIAPMIHDAPLHLVTDRTDGEVRSSVDPAHTCPAASAGALRCVYRKPYPGFIV
jgi:hypothetical protein